MAAGRATRMSRGWWVAVVALATVLAVLVPAASQGVTGPDPSATELATASAEAEPTSPAISWGSGVKAW